MRPKIFAAADWYLPAMRAGGMVTAVSRFVEILGDKFDVFVCTRDRDLGGDRPFPGIAADAWIPQGNAHVFYGSSLTGSVLRKQLKRVDPDVIFLNSVFSILTIRILFSMRFGRAAKRPVVLAPHGEFSSAALEIKRRRKQLFLRLAVLAGIYDGILWCAASSKEESEIQRVLLRICPRSPEVRTIGQVPAPQWFHTLPCTRKPAKNPGSARFIFLARISPIKNLSLALDLLNHLSGDIQLDIYGPIEDKEYWKRCQSQMESLPRNVVARYCGALYPSEVAKTSEHYHFLLLPTLGENFCYVIPETMASGCAPVVSDQTPWQDLAAHNAGWTLPLNDRRAWEDCLNRCLSMDSDEFNRLSANAQEYVRDWASNSRSAQTIIALFESQLRTEPKSQQNLAPVETRSQTVDLPTPPSLAGTRDASRR